MSPTPHITKWSAGLLDSATTLVGCSALAARAHLNHGDIAALIAASADTAAETSVASLDAGGSFTGHLFIEPVSTGAWAGTWWTHAHSWSAGNSNDLRALWAQAAEPAFNAGAREFYSIVPAHDPLLPTWHSLSFGIQHVVADLPDSAIATWPTDSVPVGAEFHLTRVEPADASGWCRVDSGGWGGMGIQYARSSKTWYAALMPWNGPRLRPFDCAGVPILNPT